MNETTLAILSSITNLLEAVALVLITIWLRLLSDDVRQLKKRD